MSNTLCRRHAECSACSRLVNFISEEHTDAASIAALKNNGWTDVRATDEPIYWTVDGSEKKFGDKLFSGKCEECSGNWPPTGQPG